MAGSRFIGMTLNERLVEADALTAFDDALATRDQKRLSEILDSVDASPGTAEAPLGLKYSCWFCGDSIEKGGRPALSIALTNVWNDEPEFEPTQVIYAHFTCAETRMKGASMSLNPDLSFPDGTER